jgi:Asp-tRNA(Asn)/Glu-tRNA(Gln) amidotransferase A subunit family amidase
MKNKNLLSRCFHLKKQDKKEFKKDFFSTLKIDDCYQAITKHNSVINAFTHVKPLGSAQESFKGRLNNLTIAIKANISTKELPTTCSSKMLSSKLVIHIFLTIV